MDFKTFLENFDAIAQAPNGIPKLRSLILNLAVQGKLVSQNPEDEPAEKLINKNQKLILKENKGKIKSIPILQNTEGSIPKGWHRCQLADIALVVMGNSPPGSSYNKSGQGVPLINGPVEFSSGAFGLTVKIQYTTDPSRICKQGDLLVCVRGATTGRTNIAAFDACIGRGVALIRGWEAQNYLNYLLWHVGEQLLQQGKGTTFPSISYSDLAGLEVLLPPLVEQKRIVEKVDELMALCDRLQSSQQSQDNLRQKLRASAIASLMNAETDEELKQSWAIVRDNWHTLSQKPEDVGDLRRSVLQLAVRGKLVPQKSSEITASSLLKQIQLTKQKLTKEGKIRKTKPIEAVPADKVLHLIPESWEWVWIDDISDIGTGSTPLTSNPEYYEDGSIPWITSTATSQNFIYEADTYITEIAVKDHRLRLYSPGCLIVALYGQGKTRGQISELKISATINQACAAITLIEKADEHKKYIRCVFEKKYEELRALAAGGAQPNLNVGKIKETLIPLPSLDEQKRIVAKVDELMQMCDQLEDSLRQSQQRAEALAASAISHLEI